MEELLEAVRVRTAGTPAVACKHGCVGLLAVQQYGYSQLFPGEFCIRCDRIVNHQFVTNGGKAVRSADGENHVQQLFWDELEPIVWWWRS